MVNNDAITPNLRRIGRLLALYVASVAGTLVALAVLSSTGHRHQATQHAWGHAVVVAVFAVVLPVRLRAARRGSVAALRAVGLIAAALLLVNVVEALIPGFVPTWMRIEMIGFAALMAAVVAFVVRERV